MKAEHLQLYRPTRDQFLESVVRCVNQFWAKKGKTLDAKEEETPNKIQNDDIKVSKVAKALGKRVWQEVTRFFNLLYCKEFILQDVCSRV
jgi:hypothetical protein